MAVWTIVVAAGGGARFGGTKQFAALRGATVLDRSIATALRCSEGVVVALPAEAAGTWRPPAAGVCGVKGGASRSASVRAALASVPDHADVIVVHDAARPLASPLLYAAVIGAVRAGADAAVPGLPVSDTIKRVDDDGSVVATIPRDALVAVQTPQAFAAAALRAAHARGGDDTDDAALVERGGGRVVVVAGEARNLKITVPGDLEMVAALLDAP
jgi:2-C-methyl-D-erythritol 4-phosphate cytidylyltransferase